MAPGDTELENRIYDLQQVISVAPPDQWGEVLERLCPDDRALRQIVIERERAARGLTLETPARLAIATTAPPALQPGTMRHDRYRIISPVGVGGMGAVYQALDLRLHNIVAIKQLTAAGDDANLAFEREAGLLAALRHPALPVVIDFFVDDHGRYLVMQYIDGEDMAALLKRQGSCAPDEVLAWGLALLDVLEYLHSHEPPIVHRDIKPSNIKRTPRGEIVLLDFGLAKRLDTPVASGGAPLTVAWFTPDYSPPEQIDRHGTDSRSDLFALAATLYHLATGAAPPSAKERLDRRAQGSSDPLVSAHAVKGQLSTAFAETLTRVLALDPKDRPSTAAEMRALLLGGRPAPADAQPMHAPGDQRRIDAALPSRTEVGRQVDLIVQIRFADSPLLGLEDWPTRRRPDLIEQGSEAIRVKHPLDPVTRRPMPARLKLKIVAPDFTIDGHTEQLLDVPPDDYSRRVAFLLSPQRVGFCRVNVEVYGTDAVYLGVIPIEAEAIAADAAGLPGLVQVANLSLVMLASEGDAVERLAPNRRRLIAWVPAWGTTLAVFLVAGTVMWQVRRPVETGGESSGAKKWVHESVDDSAVTVTVVSARSSDGLRLAIAFENKSLRPVTVEIDWNTSRLVDDAGNAYDAIADSQDASGNGTLTAAIAPSASASAWVVFDVPRLRRGWFLLTLGSSNDTRSGIDFPPVRFEVTAD